MYYGEIVIREAIWAYGQFEPCPEAVTVVYYSFVGCAEVHSSRASAREIGTDAYLVGSPLGEEAKKS